MRPADRERLLHNFSSVIEAYAEELAQLETINQGKFHISRAIEVGGSVEYIRYMAGWNIYGLRLSAGRGAAQLRGQANAIDGGWTAQ